MLHSAVSLCKILYHQFNPTMTEKCDWHIKHQLNSNKTSIFEVKVIKHLKLGFYDVFETPISSIQIMSMKLTLSQLFGCFMISTQCEL